MVGQDYKEPNRKPTPMLLVLIILGLLLVLLAFALIKPGDNPDSSDTPSPTPTATPDFGVSPSPTPTPTSVDYEAMKFTLKGICSSTLLDNEIKLYEDNPCRVINADTDETLLEFRYSETDTPYIGAFSAIYLGNISGKTLNVFRYGSEGGDSWVTVYKIDLSTGITTKAADSGVSLQEIKNPTGTKKNCTNNCSVIVRRLDSAVCRDPLNDKAYLEECFSNWSSLTEVSQSELLIKQSALKSDAQNYFATLKDYQVSYYINLEVIDFSKLCKVGDNYNDCRKSLTIKNTPSCQDIAKAEAYSEDCFTNLNSLTNSEREKVKGQLSVIRSNLSKYGIVDTI